MIDEKEYLDYYHKRKLGTICFHCLEKIQHFANKEAMIAISTFHDDIRRDLYFHVSCFKEIAGNKYIVFF